MSAPRHSRLIILGSGPSGYAAAVLSRLAGEVVSIERHETLAARARATLAELDIRNVEVRLHAIAVGRASGAA